MEILTYSIVGLTAAALLGVTGWFLVNFTTNIFNLIIGQVKTVLFYKNNKSLADNINALDAFYNTLDD